MVFDVMDVLLLVDPASSFEGTNGPFESVAAIASVEAPCDGGAVIGPEKHSCVHTLGDIGREVKCSSQEKSSRVSRLSSKHVDRRLGTGNNHERIVKEEGPSLTPAVFADISSSLPLQTDLLRTIGLTFAILFEAAGNECPIGVDRSP